MTDETGRMSRNVARVSIACFLIAVAAWYLFIASIALTLTLDYYDSYEILLNARAIGGGDVAAYSTNRPFALPLLLAPLAWLERTCGQPDLFLASHVLAAIFTAAFIGVAWRLLRFHVDPPAAGFGLLLLLCNPVLINAAPLAKEDVPAACCVGLAFYLYLHWRERWTIGRLLILAGAVTLASTMRYNLIPLVASVILLHELILLMLSQSWTKRLPENVLSGLLRLTVFAAIAPLFILLFIIPTLLYPRLGISPPGEAMAHFMRQLILVLRTDSVSPQPPAQYIAFLQLSITPPVLLLALIGAIHALRARDRSKILPAIWLGIFFFVHAFIIWWKEARILLSFILPIYIFAATGAATVAQGIRSLSPRRAAVLLPLLGFLTLLLPAAAGMRAGLRYLDPLYRSDFPRRLARLAEEAAKADHRILWYGTFYALHPRDYFFHPEDEYTAIYHIHSNTLRFYSPRISTAYVFIPPFMEDTSTGAIAPGHGLAAGHLDGDVLIMNPEPYYSTASMPARMKPLTLQRLRISQYRRTDGEYFRTEDGSESIRVRCFSDHIDFETAVLPPGLSEIHVRADSDTRYIFTAVKVTPDTGRPVVQIWSRALQGGAPRQIDVIRFEWLATISPP